MRNKYFYLFFNTFPLMNSFELAVLQRRIFKSNFFPYENKCLDQQKYLYAISSACFNLYFSRLQVVGFLLSLTHAMVEKVLFLGQIFEVEVL